MTFWLLYFIAVTYWQLSQAINADVYLNLGICLFALYPITEAWPHEKAIRLTKNIIAFVLGVFLLWHESYLPPIKTLWEFLTLPELRPSGNFVLDFISSHFNWNIFVVLIAIIPIAYVLTHTKLIKYVFLLFAACLAVLFFAQQKNISEDLSGDFFTQESKRSIEITQSPQNEFDVVILQICSLSWSDLSHINFNFKPFWGKFDYILTNFNSATSYSDPAALRLLQGECGQKTEGELFSQVPEKCYLMENLRRLGYSTSTALNHDGVYSDFTNIIQKYGKADPPLKMDDLRAIELNFDNSPIYKDGEVLNEWLDQRGELSGKSALYYNSITLHTGASYMGSQKINGDEQYTIAIQNTLDDLNVFFEKIKKTNRKTVVILLGEHGAALQGSAVQLPTVRDIPLPSITQVPAVIKIFGPNFNDQESGQNITINSPTSYLALIKLLSNILENNPTSQNVLRDKKIIQDLPITDFISETGTSLVSQNDAGVFYRSKQNKNWEQLPKSLTTQPADYLIQ